MSNANRSVAYLLATTAMSLNIKGRREDLMSPVVLEPPEPDRGLRKATRLLQK